MTDNEIRIAIAEVAGWKEFQNADGDLSEPHLTRTWMEWIGPQGEQSMEPPDYPNDLNAMHEAEKVLTDHTGYWQWIERVQGGPPLKFPLLHATAHQRAEAFLRTVGKWKEKPLRA